MSRIFTGDVTSPSRSYQVDSIAALGGDAGYEGDDSDDAVGGDPRHQDDDVRAISAPRAVHCIGMLFILM
jgi:hypothetical protein